MANQKGQKFTQNGIMRKSYDIVSYEKIFYALKYFNDNIIIAISCGLYNMSNRYAVL